MADIKLIALDLDGTLLDSRKQLSGRNRRALEQCIEKGVYIVPSTGRPADGIPDVVKNISGVRYAITMNGAVIMDLKTGRRIDSRAMPFQLALELLKYAETCFEVMYDPYIDGRAVTEPKFYDNLESFGLSPEMIQVIHMTRDVYPNIIEFVEVAGKPVEKINLYFPDLNEKARMRAELEMRNDIIITSANPHNLELNAPGATKGEAIIRLAGHLNLSREQTMALGDGENDLSMICEAGLGVAMKNSHPKLIEAADDVTGTNDEDGVWSAICKWLPDFK